MSDDRPAVKIHAHGDGIGPCYCGGVTKHTHAELSAGAKPRRWHGDRDSAAEGSAADIRVHNCAASRCGDVCTFGEW